jgi:hypothetical protein
MAGASVRCAEADSMPDGRRLKWYGVLAIGISFTIAGVYIAVTKDSGGWFVALFFGFCAAMAVHELWPQVVEGKRRYDATAILQRFPGPVRLRVPKRKLIFFFACFIAFGVSLVWIALNTDPDSFEKAVLWIGAIGIAVAAPLFAMMILHGSTLRLDAEGFEVFQGLKCSKYLWADAGEFSVADVNVLASAEHLLVMFDDAKTKDGTVARMGRRLTGFSDALPDTYGMEVWQLASLMNGWRQRALALSGSISLPP